MLSESYSPTPHPVSSCHFMKTEMPVSCSLCCPGPYVGHNSGDRNRTPNGVYVSGSCIIILYEIQALGGGGCTPQMVLSGAQGTVAQNVKELFASKGSELGLRISELLIAVWLLDQCCELLWAGKRPTQPRSSWSSTFAVTIKGRVCLLLFITRTIDALGFFRTPV